MRSSRARSASPTRGAIQRPKAWVPQPYFGCSTRVVWLATSCATKLSQVGHRLATTASLGAARRPENGRSRADPAARQRRFFREGNRSGVARGERVASRSGRKLLRKNRETRRSPVDEQRTRTGTALGPLKFGC